MKTKKIFTVLAVALLLTAFGACKKSRYCHCVTKEGEPDTVVINIDRGMTCKHITDLGIERLQDGHVQVTTQKVYCMELDMDTVDVIPPRP